MLSVVIIDYSLDSTIRCALCLALEDEMQGVRKYWHSLGTRLFVTDHPLKFRECCLSVLV